VPAPRDQARRVRGAARRPRLRQAPRLGGPRRRQLRSVPPRRRGGAVERRPPPPPNRTATGPLAAARVPGRRAHAPAPRSGRDREVDGQERYPSSPRALGRRRRATAAHGRRGPTGLAPASTGTSRGAHLRRRPRSRLDAEDRARASTPERAGDLLRARERCRAAPVDRRSAPPRRLRARQPHVHACRCLTPTRAGCARSR
jgi:hypothetical protein